MKVLYLDESGTHNITSPEPDYPVFVLGGVIMGKDYAEGAATNRLTGLYLIAKADRLAGLELADLIASPIGRHLLGKPEHKDWDIVKSKFKRNEDDDYNGVGLTTLP